MKIWLDAVWSEEGTHQVRNRMFPVGLYAVLLAGLVGVTFPELTAPIEIAARTVVALPLRAYSILLAEHPVLANSVPTTREDVFAAQERTVLRDAMGPSGYTPRVCRVVSHRAGPSGLVDELILDRTAAELRGCAPLVTVGRGLIGFLAPADEHDAAPGIGARVRLLHYQQRRRDRRRPWRVTSPFRPIRVAAEVVCDEADAERVLRFLVEPARRADRWLLRCSLLDDSYLASRLHHSGDVVRTSLQFQDPLLPAGLTVGRMMIWGYPDLDIPVGLFVRPVCDPRSISAVVLWQPAALAPQSSALRPDQRGRFLPVRLTRYPAPRPAGVRWLVTSGARTDLPDGAALVDRGRLLGRLREPWSGQSMVTPFAASGRSWALLLLTPAGDVVAWIGRVAGRCGDGRLRLEALAGAGSAEVPARVIPARGELFTGVNGRHCPAGFLIGTMENSREGLLLTLPETGTPQPEVFVGDRGEGR